MPYNLVSPPVLISLVLLAHAFYSDRRSQLISSSSRVVSSAYAGPTFRTDDEMRQTEDDDDDLLTPYGPPDPFGNDLDWDGGDRVISGVPIPRSSNVNVKRVEARVEDHRTSFRGQVKVDERTSLLPRVSEEAPAPIVSGRQLDCVPTKSVSVVIGQSTFCLTVNPAFQCHRPFGWYRHAFGAPCVLVRGMDLRHLDHRLLWLRHVLYVCHRNAFDLHFTPLTDTQGPSFWL